MPIHVTTVSLALFSIASISDASSSVSKPYATKLCGFCGKRVQTLAYVCACTTFKYRYNLNSLRRVFKFSGFITLEPMQTPTSCIRACTWWQFKRNPRQRSTMKEINPSSKNAGKKRKHKSKRCGPNLPRGQQAGSHDFLAHAVPHECTETRRDESNTKRIPNSINHGDAVGEDGEQSLETDAVMCLFGRVPVRKEVSF